MNGANEIKTDGRLLYETEGFRDLANPTDPRSRIVPSGA